MRTPDGPHGVLPAGAPDVLLDPLLLADVEAALLGVLPEAQHLGGPIEDAPTAHDGARAIVHLPVAPEVAAAAHVSGVIVLRDAENTPVAALRCDGGLVDAASAGDGWISGSLSRLQRREGLPDADLGLTPAEAASRPDGAATVVVIGRPLTTADEPALEEVLARADGSVWVLVADQADDEVPTDVLVRATRDWFAPRRPDARGLLLRTVPLAWRDPTSDRRLARSFGRLLGAPEPVLVLREDDSDGARRWSSVRADLELGVEGALAGVPDEVAAHLLRWRPPRHERGLVIMFTGLSGAGKSTLAHDLASHLRLAGERSVTLLDGDVVRHLLSSGLGFDRAGRELNVRRISFVATEAARHGGTAICSPIAPYAGTRDEARAMASTVGGFVLVHVSTPLSECERRDTKGLYARARAGQVAHFTGVSDPYEVPEQPDLRVDTSLLDRAEALDLVLRHLAAEGWIRGYSDVAR